jgi:hypothetical protein
MMPQRQQLRRDIVALLGCVALLHCLQHVKRKRLVPPGCSSIQQINAALSPSSPLGGRFLAHDEHRQEQVPQLTVQFSPEPPRRQMQRDTARYDQGSPNQRGNRPPQ